MIYFSLEEIEKSLAILVISNIRYKITNEKKDKIKYNQKELTKQIIMVIISTTS